MVRCFWLSAIFYSACMDVFNLFHFITRVTLCVSAVFAVASCCPSVRLSRWWIVSTRLKIYSKLLVQPVRPITVVFDPLRRYPIPRGTSSAGAQNTRGGKNWRFSTEIAVYIGNGARCVHGYYGTLIGSHRWLINTCQFRWPWVTFDPDLKVMIFFEVECLLQTKL